MVHPRSRRGAVQLRRVEEARIEGHLCMAEYQDLRIEFSSTPQRSQLLMKTRLGSRAVEGLPLRDIASLNPLPSASAADPAPSRSNVNIDPIAPRIRTWVRSAVSVWLRMRLCVMGFSPFILMRKLFNRLQEPTL